MHMYMKFEGMEDRRGEREGWEEGGKGEMNIYMQRGEGRKERNGEGDRREGRDVL